MSRTKQTPAQLVYEQMFCKNCTDGEMVQAHLPFPYWGGVQGHTHQCTLCRELEMFPVTYPRVMVVIANGSGGLEPVAVPFGPPS